MSERKLYFYDPFIAENLIMVNQGFAVSALRFKNINLTFLPSGNRELVSV